MSEELKEKTEAVNKKSSKYTIYILILFFLIPMFINSLGTLLSTEDKDAVADGFTIDSYTVTLDVKDNNVIYVTEDINVNFTNSYKHGIYRSIPYWLKYTGKDNKTIKRMAWIDEFSAVGDSYTEETSHGKEVLKIGDENKYVGAGLKKYTIKYVYDMGKDPFKDFDEFIFHAYGDYWGTPINNGRLVVNMPSSIEGKNVNFFTDKYRKQNINANVKYYIDGNTLIADLNSPINSALTVDIELPDGYFKKAHNVYTNFSLVPLGIVLLMTIFTFISWIKHGKDYEKRLETVEFYPPEGLDPAIIGYIYNKNQTSVKLLPALLISLASKGFIKINEKEDKKIEIVNQIALNKYDQAKYEETMKKLSQNEKIVFDKLFISNNNSIILSDHATLWEAERLIYSNYMLEDKDTIYENNLKYCLKGVIRAMFGFVLTVFAYSTIEDLNPNLHFLYYLAFACFAINIFFVVIMGRRTKKGEELIAKVNGFRNFLDTVEKEKLEALVEENPYYFYNILPYTYVLNLSKKWIEKFEGINMPEPYMGTYNIRDESSFYDLSSNIPSAPASSSGGGGGGGCSSCGGGCSSCGGGGSW